MYIAVGIHLLTVLGSNTYTYDDPEKGEAQGRTVAQEILNVVRSQLVF